MAKELIKSTGNFDVIHSLEIAKTKILVIQQLPSLYSIHAVRHQSTKIVWHNFQKMKSKTIASSLLPPLNVRHSDSLRQTHPQPAYIHSLYPRPDPAYYPREKSRPPVQE
jgi:hypothetical protein